VFVSMRKQKHFMWKVDAISNNWLRFVYNMKAQPKCSNLCVNLVEYKAGYARRLFKKKGSTPTLL